jgi:predicted transposase YbfD/YdcC
MGCQKDIAQQIVDKGADYLLAVKGNQKKLEEAMGKVFNSSMLNSYEGDKYSIQEKGHKAGIKRKQKKANRSNAYLSQVLAGQGAS